MISENFTPPPPPISVIESLTSGFETVVNRLYLILIPLALDILIWVGPRISYQQALGALGTPEFATRLGATFQQMLFPMSPEQYFHPMLSAQYLPVLGIPSVLNSRDASQLPFAFAPPVFNVSSYSGMLLLFIGSFQVGLIVLILYFGLIAQAVNDGPNDLGRLVRRSSWIILQLLAVEGVLALPVFLCVMLSAPEMFMAQVTAANETLLGLITRIVLGSLWLTIIALFSFTIHSMLLNNRNVLGSMWDSMRVVQWNMPATLGMLILAGVIFLGMQAVWRMADTSSWITLAAIGGNAFISTGLATATFVFFKDRYRYWSEFREQLIAELERRRIIQDKQNSKKS